MANSSVLRWAIAGAGRISSSFATAVNMLPPEEHKLLAVGSRSVDRSKEFAARFNIPLTYGSYEELASNKDIDVVYIGVIHPMHKPLIKLFLNAGVNVLCEKPITMSAKEAEECIELARQKQLFLMEGFWSRFFPVYDELRKELNKKSIGDPLVVSANFGFPQTDRYEGHWMEDKDAAGGALLALGSYLIQFAQLVFNHEMPKKIIATGVLNEKDGRDETVTATLIYSNNRVANIMCSAVSGLDQTGSVYGTKSNIGCTQGYIKIPLLWSPETIITAEGTKHFPVPKSDPPPAHGRGEGFMYQARSVRECLSKGLKENPLITLDQTLQIQKIMDEIRKQIGLVYECDSQ